MLEKVRNVIKTNLIVSLYIVKISAEIRSLLIKWAANLGISKVLKAAIPPSI